MTLRELPAPVRRERVRDVRACGSFPINVTNSVATLALSGLGLAGLGTIGAGTLHGFINLSFGGNSGVLALVGQEVGRTYIPEPNTFAMLGLGLLGMAGLASRRRRG